MIGGVVSSRMKPMRTLLAAALLSLALAAPAAAQMPRFPDRATVTISGEGSVRAAPDIASITIGVVTEAKEAGAALEANSTRMQNLVAAVKAAGIADADVGTSSVSLEPRLVYPDDGKGAPRIESYVARNTLSVTVRQLAKLGPLLDAAVAKGGNDVGALVFDNSDREALTDKARAAAGADARRRAEVIATAAGIRLGRVLSIEEGGDVPIPMPPRPRAMMAAKAVPIEAGSQEILARATITWEIAP